MRFNARLPAKAANPPKCLPAVHEPYCYVQHRFNDTRNAELGGTDGQVGVSQPSALIWSANYPSHTLYFLTDYVIYIPGQKLNRMNL